MYKRQQYKKLYERYPQRGGVVLNLAISLINDDRAAESMQLLYRLEYENPSDANVKRALAWGYLWLGMLNVPKSYTTKSYVVATATRPTISTLATVTGFYATLVGQ